MMLVILLWACGSLMGLSCVAIDQGHVTLNDLVMSVVFGLFGWIGILILWDKKGRDKLWEEK